MTVRTLTQDEQTKLNYWIMNILEADFVSKQTATRLLIITLLFEAGLRVGELVKLKTFDLYTAEDPNTYIELLGKSKTKFHQRRIPLSKKIQAALSLYYKTVILDGNHLTYNSYIFKSRNDSHISTRQIERIIRTHFLELINRPIHPHLLRHTFATNLLRVTNIRTVQSLLGHQSLSSTQVYTHPNDDDLNKAINSL